MFVDKMLIAFFIHYSYNVHNVDSYDFFVVALKFHYTMSRCGWFSNLFLFVKLNMNLGLKNSSRNLISHYLFSF